MFVAPNIKVRGVKVASWRVPNRVEVDKDSWFFFVDEQPGANWEHQAKYILVDKISGIVRSFKAKTPPRGWATNADTDGDGKVNMSEAHYYARSHDNRNEHPTIGSCITHACDATLFPKLALIKKLPVKKK